MQLNNFLEFKKKETLVLILLFLFSFLVRIPVIIILGDTVIENEWNWLLYNLINHKVLSLGEYAAVGQGTITFDGFLLPNLWMPPLYAYYLYVFSFFNLENQSFVLLILFSQILLASVSVGIFYKINSLFFSQKISFYSSLLFSIFPIYLYACSQISSVSLTVFLAMFFYYYFFKIASNSKFIYIFLFSVAAGLLILVRREFIAIIILSGLYLFFYYKIPFKKIFLVILISLITISPYLVRNYLIFERIIIHSGFGYNLWQGNNPYSNVEGVGVINKSFQDQIDKIPRDKFYKINEDKLFFNEAVKSIKNDPKKYLILYFKKTLSYFFIDLNSTRPNYYNPLHYFPIILLGITTLMGVFLSNKKSYHFNYLILILVFYIFTFSIFAIQPRYKLFIIPLQIILSNIFIDRALKKIFHHRS